MPRKPRITAVPVDPVKPEEGLMVAMDEKTEAELLTDIINDVREEPREEPKDAESDAVAISKPKAKRASRAKPKEEPQEVEPREEKILALEVADQREPEPKEEATIDDKVACPD